MAFKHVDHEIVIIAFFGVEENDYVAVLAILWVELPSKRGCKCRVWFYDLVHFATACEIVLLKPLIGQVATVLIFSSLLQKMSKVLYSVNTKY